MIRKRNKTRYFADKRLKKRPNVLLASNSSTNLLFNPGRYFMPTRLNTNLTFNKFSGIVNVGLAYANERFEVTNAFDIDPTIGSTAMPGFTELAGIYRLYRVNGARYRVSFSNSEAFNVVAYVKAVNFDPGSNTSGFQAYLSSNDVQLASLGPLTGMNSITLEDTVTVGDFGGVVYTGQSDFYSGATNGSTVPSNNVWLIAGIYSGGAAQVLGAAISVSITLDIDFYELSSPAT